MSEEEGRRIPKENWGVTKSSPAAKIGWFCSTLIEHLLWARLVLSALQILICIFNPRNSCTMLATLIPILQVRKFKHREIIYPSPHNQPKTKLEFKARHWPKRPCSQGVPLPLCCVPRPWSGRLSGARQP